MNNKIFNHIKPLQVTEVYNSYWYFASERQNIFFKRLLKEEKPWTLDKVIEKYKFTNAYRASDRVSQYLIKNVIYRKDLSEDINEVLFRIILFKIFNKISTWELLESNFGEMSLKNYKYEYYDKILTDALKKKATIYSAAYIMPPGGKAFGHPAKHQNHLQLLELMMRNKSADILAKTKKMQQAFEFLKSYPTLGDFLAYQLVTDINYSEITNFSEMDFVVPGPGARDGIKKCFSFKASLNEAEIIRFMADNQEKEFQRLGIEFKSLWGRPLQLIDCQNIFCEIDKYSRVAYPSVSGFSGRKRIKQQYKYTGSLETPWYPPKWGINEKITIPQIP